MKSSAKKVELASVDDLFSTEESRADAQREKVVEIPLSELHPFKGHPFKVKDDEAMMETADSIKQYGVLVPAIARPDPEGGYELVAGHRRHRASELAEKETMPVIVRDLDDDAATIIMVDSNLQRESLLPSERAFAYKMKLDAMKHQGERVDLTSSQVGTKLRADEKVAKDSGESRNQVQRFVRLTNLVPELLDMVDEKKISFNPAVELSYLDEKQQQDFLEAMDASQNAPSLSQAIRIKKLAQQGEFDYDAVYNIMNEEKKSELDTVPVIVRNMEDDAATILMVDSNLQREHILPSERAFAYKMKLDAIKNQGARSDLTSPQLAAKFRSDDAVAKDQGISGDTVRRYIRLTSLIPELLDMVDEKKISFNPAVELSYLDESQQRDFLEAMNDTQNAPSLSQAQQLKKMAQQGDFSYEKAFDVMEQEKKSEKDTVTIKNETLRKYFPRSYTPKQMEEKIIQLLDAWQKKQQRRNER